MSKINQKKRIFELCVEFIQYLFTGCSVQKIKMRKFNTIDTGRLGMNKGKTKKNKDKYMSVVLVPHSSNHVRVFKFKALYIKLTAFIIILIAVFTGGGLFISNVLAENEALKKNLSELYDANSEQRKLLNEKNDEIEELKRESAEFRETVNEKIKEYTEKFNKLTDDYLIQQNSTKTSRSVGKEETGFSNDIKELKASLDGLINLYSRSDIPVADLTAAEEKLAAYFDTIPTLWPTSSTRITDYYGYRKDPFTRKKTFHHGIDIGADYGANIVAAASGKVIMAEKTSGYGRVVKIDHGRGIVTVYGHASQLLVKAGQTVKKGDVIAKVGSTGRSTGPHLHFEVLLYGTTVDPLKYLDSR